LRRVLQSDPGQEYFVYIPSSGGHGAPLLVAVHGVSGNAKEQARLFSEYCEAYGVVLMAPHFAAEQHGDYQRLGRSGRGDRADVALDAIVEEVAWLTGASTAEIHLFGYSGGAQFAHRYTLAHPHRVARAVIASAGWYTFPDRRRRYPYGIRPSKDLPGVSFDPEEFLRVPITVVVGELDTTSEGVRRTEKLDQQQGETRVERARNWVAAMREAAAAHQLKPLVTFEQVVGGSHSFELAMKRDGLGDRVFASLFGIPFTLAEGGSNGKEGPNEPVRR
jgi:pimeloyl-ACP methyl ester carboxylesterase